MKENIEIREANVHNLKNVSLDIPKNKLVVFTGVSGSGKSSLAFDTLYAEGQRRYVESLSSYARQFLGLMEKPDVKAINGLSPAISIDQKTSSNNPRSTVGTVTEIYDYLRLLYARTGVKHCPKSGEVIEEQTLPEIANKVQALISEKQKSAEGTKIRIQVLSPIIQSRKGQHTDLLESMLSKGFLRARINGEVYQLDEPDTFEINKNKKNNIELVIDRLVPPSLSEATDQDLQEFEKRLVDALELATNKADGEVVVEINGEDHFYSENAISPVTKISFPKLTPASFSFNSPHGACENCDGLGKTKEVIIKETYNPKLSITEGGIFPWSNKTTKDTWTLKVLQKVAEVHGFSLKDRLSTYDEKTLDLIFNAKGAQKTYEIEYTNKRGQTKMYDAKFKGVVADIKKKYQDTSSRYVRKELEKYLQEIDCPSCEGRRLRPYPLAVTVNDKSIDDIVSMPIEKAITFIKDIDLKGSNKEIAEPINKEIATRLQFLVDVGLEYLTLDRRANTLSGGESQRIRLASQVGTGLTGVLFVLDEPSIGLHSRDVSRLIKTLEDLRDIGNTVVVVEHDYDTIMTADYLVDIGPGAGELGGEIVAAGTPKEVLESDSTTAKYLTGKKIIGEDIEKPKEKEQKKPGKLSITGVKTHNLKDVEAEIPLGKFVCVTGVSGSGKSSLINDTLYPILMNEKMKGKQPVGEYRGIDGLDNVDKVIGIDQSPIGRTPRSNPATYTGAFDYIRDLFAETPEAKARGYKPGRFSFNVKGGRCEKCRGEGQIKIEMQFLPDIYVKCDECEGKRYNKEALQIDYKGKNIADVLDMTTSEAKEFFSPISPLKRRLQLLEDVGLGYIRLGQSAVTLSGGESQRIKLSKELAKMVRGHTVYILDEPTTGLHFHDVHKLLGVIMRLIRKGHTVITIEHNMDLIRHSDWIIDLGPDGGIKGGEIVAEGTPEEVMNNPKSHTGRFLKEYNEKIQKMKK